MSFCLLATLAALCLQPATSRAQVAHTSYQNITTDATTTIKSGAGVLASICVNTPAATETITIYDNTAASGAKIGTITVYASTNPCFYYNANFLVGLTIVTATAAGDITVGYQ
jgi:hypothetical protein